MKAGGALDESDLEVLRIIPESLTVLPKDTSGRIVIYLERSGRDLALSYNRMVYVRALWYVLHLLIPLDCVQELGIVGISNYNTYGQCTQYDRIQTKFIAYTFCFALPLRVAASHMCCRTMIGAMILKTVLFFASRDIRLRNRVHDASEGTSLVQELEAFGMTKAGLPARLGGDFRFENHTVLQGDDNRLPDHVEGGITDDDNDDNVQ